MKIDPQKSQTIEFCSLENETKVVKWSQIKGTIRPKLQCSIPVSNFGFNISNF